ncbi:MAG TPA: hypothetical protein VFL31_03320 [Nitrospiraceae bacterium]|nr:hypothetical protein [Nitrospiraceae bacterium]
MADLIRTAQYFKVQVPDKPGEVARLLRVLQEANVYVRAFYAYPRNRRTQVDFMPDDPAWFKQVASQAKWKVQGPKTCFLVEGDDRTGALAEVTAKLGAAKINITAINALAAGQGRFGALFWVKPVAVNKAAKVLGVG